MSNWFPKSRRLGPGQYIVECGDESVPVKKIGSREWITRTKEGGLPFTRLHGSKAEATEYAIEWLQERA